MKGRIVLTIILVLVSSLPATAGDGSGLAEGFLQQGLNAQAANKAFDVAGNRTIKGRLGIGIQDPEGSVHVRSNDAVFRMDRTSNSVSFILARTEPGTNNVIQAWTFGGRDDSFIINDLGNKTTGAGTRRLTVDLDGNFGMNIEKPKAALHLHATTSGRNGAAIYVAGQDDSKVFELLTDGTLDLSETPSAAMSTSAMVRTNSVVQTGANIRYMAGNGYSQGGKHQWFVGGSESINEVMEIPTSGNLKVRGTVQDLSSFDLAEVFWKGETPISPGDVVRVSRETPNAVVLSDREADPAVLGVVSTAPGFVLGGGAFSAEGLREVWGEAVAALFENQREQLEAEAIARNEGLRQRTLQLESFEGFRAALSGQVQRQEIPLVENQGFDLASVAPAALERLHARYDDALSQLGDDREQAALELFFQEHFVRVSLAGRVPVKVDAGYGAVEVGDLLVASPNAGHAMRIEEAVPGTVLGTALEPLDAGQGMVLMMVMMR